MMGLTRFSTLQNTTQCLSFKIYYLCNYAIMVKLENYLSWDDFTDTLAKIIWYSDVIYQVQKLGGFLYSFAM